MCVEYPPSFPPSSSSRLALPTTPPTLHFDQASINDGTVSEQETVLESPTDALSHHLLPHRFVSVHVDSSSHRVTSVPRYLNSPVPSVKQLGKRPASPELLTPPLSPERIPSKKRSKMDMNMAEKGSLAALSAFQTPLATYVAQMVVWLWYGDFTKSQPLTSSPLATSPIPHDPFDVSYTPQARISPLMVHPTPEFSKFVATLLSVTSVSHSVTLVALLYIYRLKMRNKFFSTPGSEQRPFVAGLMLGNKYLDDNTYTNATWAELAGMPLVEINKMESEFLVGMNYELGVEVNSFHQWKILLDEFMLARGPYNPASRHSRHLSTGKCPYTVNPAATPLMPVPPAASSRARSASPPRAIPAPQIDSYGFPPNFDHTRKRSAVDAFTRDNTSTANVYESLRMPVRKAAFTQPLQSTQNLQPTLSVMRARPGMSQQGSGSGSSVARSSSLSRRQARLAIESGEVAAARRGSAGQLYVTPIGAVGQPSPTAQHITMMPGSAGETVYGQWDGGRALLAPYQCQPQAHVVPPEHLMFYSLAAEAHPGVDGAPRKAILRYQDPNPPFTYPYQQQGYSAAPQYHFPPPTATTPYVYDDVTMHDPNSSPLNAYPSNMYQYPHVQDVAATHPVNHGIYDSSYPANLGWSPTPTQPEPAQFANAGPPGFVYMPAGSTWKHHLPQPPATASTSSFYAGSGQGPATIGLGLNAYGMASTPALVSASDNGSMVPHQPYPVSEVGYPIEGMTATPTDGMRWASRSEWSSPMMQRYA